MKKCFSGHFYEKQMRQAGFNFYFFISPKNRWGQFFKYILSKPYEAPFFVHILDILILTYE